jgi:hypothetical protein
MNQKTYNGTIRALEECIADASRPEKIRRACALRLARLKSATRPQGAGLRLTATRPTATRTTAKPAPLPIPTEKARFEALQSFLALSRHRSALHRKRRSTSEQSIFSAMVALMPAGIPTTDDAQQWRNFIAQVEGVLAEIKSAKTL